MSAYAAPSYRPIADELARRLDARRVGREHRALCPAHEDKNPSLDFRDDDGRLIVTCRAGCSNDAVWRALSAKHPDLFVARDNPALALVRQREQRYPIRDVAGALQAVKIRRDTPNGKRFFLEGPSGSKGLGGRPVASLPFYGSEHLQGLPNDYVVVAEGEKAADAARSHGFLAVATVTGAAGCPDAAALEALRGRRVILWPDADAPGKSHMQKIGRALEGIAASVSIVEPLPSSPKGFDAADVASWEDALHLVTSAVPFDAAACESCGSDSCAGCASQDVANAEPASSELQKEARHYIETAESFLNSAEEPERPPIINELVPAESTVLLHGEPRVLKSWQALEQLIAACTGTPAYGLERFGVTEPVPVLYATQEDGRRTVKSRVSRVLAGRGITRAPEHLYFSVHAGINLQDLEWQDQLIEDGLRLGIKFFAIDPIRRFAPDADKGPAEVREITIFWRRLTVETGAAVELVHHDVKPARDEKDSRRRGHRASGGDWFAAADCPIHAERAGKGRVLVVPEDYKHSADPAPFTFRLEEDEARTWIRLVGEDAEGADLASLALHERILEYLQHNPGSNGSAVARGAKGGKLAVLDALKALDERGLVDSVVEKRGTRWYVKGQQ